MSNAAAKLRCTEQTADFVTSVDVTWQRKGFSSTLQLVTVISVNSGKVLEVAILLESCKGCTSMKKIVLSDPARYETWNSYHVIVILIIMALSPE